MTSDVGRSGADAPSGSQASPGAATASPPSVSIPNAGATSLRQLGLDYYYDAEDWEVTYDSGDLEAVGDWLIDQGYVRGTREVATLVSGPTLVAVHYPISWVDDSDPDDIDDWEVRFFASREQALSAVAQAIEARRAATAKTGAVHESAVPQGCAQGPIS